MLNFLISLFLLFKCFSSGDRQLVYEIKNIIFNSVKYFDENISWNGGYVWYYKKDLSRRWGELEAFPSMIWLQGYGTVAMGNLFLDIYEVTNEEYYYELAKKTAFALIQGQLECGGWNYFIDFAGKESTLKWYSTIGANAWRMEEFHNYYDNATFDDEVTTGAAKFLLRIYLLKKDTIIKNALYKAIKFIVDSQLKNGAWPQRFPIITNNYTGYATFNDNVIWNNIKFLILCYATLKEHYLIEPIKKGMEFYLISQYKSPQAGWAQQYNENLEPAMARSYEPAALDPEYTARHINILIKFFEMTGDKKFLSRIPEAINWLYSVALENKDSILTVPKFVELKTNKPLFIHRKGTNKYFGRYFIDYENKNIVAHYPCTRIVNIKSILNRYKAALSNAGTDKSIIKIPLLNNDNYSIKSLEEYLKLPEEKFFDLMKREISTNRVKDLISRVKTEELWLSKNVYVSNPFIDDIVTGDSTSVNYNCSFVGDKFDTSTYPNQTEEEFISVREFISNIKYLLNYLEIELRKVDN